MASRGWDQFLNPQEPEQPSPSRSTKLVTRYDWDAFLNPTTMPQTWQIYPDQQDPITPPATITQQPGFLPKLFDYLSRTLYASANFAEEIVDKNYWYYDPSTLLNFGLVNRDIQGVV